MEITIEPLPEIPELYINKAVCALLAQAGPPRRFQTGCQKPHRDRPLRKSSPVQAQCQSASRWHFGVRERHNAVQCQWQHCCQGQFLSDSADCRRDAQAGVDLLKSAVIFHAAFEHEQGCASDYGRPSRFPQYFSRRLYCSCCILA